MSKNSLNRHRLCSQRAWWIGMMAGLLGCAESGQDIPRVSVAGQVTFHGIAVENGSILFIPQGGTEGPRAGAVIETGEYRLSRTRGPVVGRLRVEIRTQPELGYDITEPTESVKHIGESLPKNKIPPRYNDQSVLIVETKADGDNSFDFHLPLTK